MTDKAPDAKADGPKKTRNLSTRLGLGAFLIVILFAVISLSRHGTHRAITNSAFFDPSQSGNPTLLENLYMFLGHPEVYILLPAVIAIIWHVVALVSRKPVARYLTPAYAAVAAGCVAFIVLFVHMYDDSYSANPGFDGTLYFILAIFVLVVPPALMLFSWISAIWDRTDRITLPMYWTAAAVYLILLGGIPGILTLIPSDASLQDTYYVVVHFSYLLKIVAIFAVFAVAYDRFQAISHFTYNIWLGRLHFWTMFLGINLVLVPPALAIPVMPKRYVEYSNQFELWNRISSIGGIIFLAAFVVFVVVLAEAFIRRRTIAPKP